MTIIDITRTVQDAPLYPGTPVPSIERLSDVNKGDLYSVSRFVFTSHLGTHADAFSHFVAGAQNIDQLPPDYYYGPAKVVTVPPNAIISQKDLEGKLEDTERLVIHGGGSSYLSKSAVDYIIAEKIKTIVTDAWSVGPLHNEAEIHRPLFNARIAVVENVVLDGVPDGLYTLAAFPLKIRDGDGAPVRAVLLKE
jgi:arylformamidase